MQPSIAFEASLPADVGGVEMGAHDVVERQGLEITAQTVEVFWDRERMDCDLDVSAPMTYDDHPIDKQ